MSRRAATWSTRQGALIADGRARVRVGAVLGYGVILAIGLTFATVFIAHGLPTLRSDGPRAQVPSRYGTIDAWVPVALGAFMGAVFLFGAAVAALSPTSRLRVLLRLTPDAVVVLTAGTDPGPYGGVPVSVAWDDVEDVRVEERDGRVRLVVQTPGHADGVVMVDLAEAYPPTAVVHHFWRNPGDRAGLGRRGGERTAERVLAAVRAAA